MLTERHRRKPKEEAKAGSSVRGFGLDRNDENWKSIVPVSPDTNVYSTSEMDDEYFAGLVSMISFKT